MDLAGATRADLLTLLAQRDAERVEARQALREQHDRIVGLVERVAELETRLGRGSSSSSEPPPSDSPYRKNPELSLRGSSGRKTGK